MFLRARTRRNEIADTNERTTSGKALMAYLQALGVLMHKVSPKAKSSYQRSQEDKKAGRIEFF